MFAHCKRTASFCRLSGGAQVWGWVQGWVWVQGEMVQGSRARALHSKYSAPSLRSGKYRARVGWLCAVTCADDGEREGCASGSDGGLLDSAQAHRCRLGAGERVFLEDGRAGSQEGEEGFLQLGEEVFVHPVTIPLLPLRGPTLPKVVDSCGRWVYSSISGSCRSPLVGGGRCRYFVSPRIAGWRWCSTTAPTVSRSWLSMP